MSGEGVIPAVSGSGGPCWPEQLTSELREILSFMCFECAPLAHAYQRAGKFTADSLALKPRAEDEQAFILHRMLLHWFRHGSAWREAMADELEAMAAEMKEGARG